MLRIAAQREEGMLFGFGLTEADLNRLQFNQEAIVFNFGYVGHPELFGLILYLDEMDTPEDILENIDAVKRCCIPFLDPSRGINTQTLRVFPIAKNILQEFRQTPFWGYTVDMQILHPKDQQMFFAGKDEQQIKQFFEEPGLLGPQTV